MASVADWASLAFSLGFLIPVVTASLAGGYILSGFMLDRAGRTVLGTHVRHFFTRIAPAKRFDMTDRFYVEELILESLRKGRMRGLMEGVRD